MTTRDLWYFRGDQLRPDVYDIVDKYATLDWLYGGQSFSEALTEDWEDSDEDLRLQVFGPHFDEVTLADCIDLYDAVMAMKTGYIL